MGIHVRNGTPLHGPSLCETCSHAHIEKGYRESEELILCGANYPMHRVQFPMRECTGYVDKTRLGLNAMERIAWVLAPQGSKRTAGFVRASEVRDEEDEIELPLDENP
jgi:hypothetical protein